MTFPFESLTTYSREAGLVIAVAIGLAFGFILERAGFGRADKLAAQFYFRDMTVFKVMFTAIVTAMLGLVAISQLGLADLRGISESIASWTWVWPMLVGGLVLGVGFIISGYCPGTSIVAAASGNIDGAMTVAGVITGTFVYSELLRIPAFAAFHESGAKEAWFLYDLLPVSPAVIAIAIAAMAVLAFIGAEKVESMVSSGTPRRAWRLTVPAFTMLAVVIAVGAAAPRTSARPAAGALGVISPSVLARQVAAEPWRFDVSGDRVTDSTNGATYAIAGGERAWSAEPLVAAMRSGAPVVAAPATRAATSFSKPKKKGGGCSS